MSGRRHTASIEVVVIAGSQGAAPVVRQVLGELPADFPAAVVYVQHRVPTSGSILAELVARSTQLEVVEPQQGDPVRAGVVHVAAAPSETTIASDRTFEVRDGACRADPLMASVASVYGPRALGVILSGRLRDGAVGLARMKAAGGRGLVQAPATADAEGMPLAAMATGCYDFVLPPRALGAALTTLVAVPGAAELFGVRAHPVALAAADA